MPVQDNNTNNNNQQGFRPYSAFPANIRREYDPNIYNIIFDLVQSKYQSHAYLERMRQLAAEGKVTLTDDIIASLESAGPDVDQIVFDFEVARVYNKLEIDIYERSTYALPNDKKQELERISAEGQARIQNGDPGAQAQLVNQINEFMQANVPGIQDIVRTYMEGFKNQYLAGRY